MVLQLSTRPIIIMEDCTRTYFLRKPSEGLIVALRDDAWI